MPSTAFNVVLRFAQQTYRFTAAWPNTILQAAQNNGIALPSIAATRVAAPPVPRIAAKAR